MRTLPFMLMSGALAATVTSGHAELRFESGPGQVAMLELFTSEGCSSCPPAEQWLGKLVETPDLWRAVVPVAWHVHYWDRLGWKDPYASRDYTARQYAYASAWRSPSVYTPCLVRNGREWQRGQPTPPAVADAGRLRVIRQDGGTLQVTFQAPANNSTADCTVTVCILGCGITNQVKAGENAGRRLLHDFVVLECTTVPLVAGPDRVLHASGPCPPIPTAPDIRRHALAVWVEASGSPAPLQATGGWLD